MQPIVYYRLLLLNFVKHLTNKKRESYSMCNRLHIFKGGEG